MADSRRFVIADTHFGHKKIVEFAGRSMFTSVEQHDEVLVQRWNSVVNKNDNVFHLGDVLFGSGAFSILPRLNGIKRLVMGNHDTYPASRYLQFFNSLHGAVAYKGCILTHIPVCASQLHRFYLNVHGHLHDGVVGDSRYICVSAEQTDFYPVLLDSLIFGGERCG